MHDVWCILDMRGLVLRSLHSGTDKDAVLDEEGKPVNSPGHALDNFAQRFLLPITQWVRLNNIIAVWDGGNTYRKHLYPEYKAHRTESTPTVKAVRDNAQRAVAELLKSLGIPQVSVPGVEADDVIAWLCHTLPDNCLVHTVDADLLQLATPLTDEAAMYAEKTVSVFLANEPQDCYRTSFTKSVKGEKVKVEIEVPFEQVALFKSIVGDSSDGYSGVPGFGPAAWVAMQEKYDASDFADLADVVDSEDFIGLQNSINPAEHPYIAKLLEKRNEWRLGWRLAKLNAKLVFGKWAGKFVVPKWTKRLPQAGRLERVAREFGCPHLVEMFGGFMPHQWLVTADFFTSADLAEVRAGFEEGPFVAMDFETWDTLQNPAFIEAANGRDYVDVISSRVTGAGFTFGRNLEHTAYFSFNHRDTANLPAEFLPALVGCVGDRPLAIQNLSFEAAVFKNQFGIDLPGSIDTKIMSSHVDERQDHGLKALSKTYLGYDQIKYKDVVPEGKTMADISGEEVLRYGADDPWVTGHLYDFFRLIQKTEGTWDFTKENEFVAVLPCVDGFLAGVEVDWEEMAKLAEEDRLAFEANMSRLRALIEANQDEDWLAKGVENLYAEASTVIEAKARKEGWEALKLAEEQYKLRESVQRRVKYEPFRQEAVEVEFLATAKQLSGVAESLGLPPIEKDTQKALKEWSANLPCDPLAGEPAQEFVYLLNGARAALKSRQGAEYEALVEFCKPIKVAGMPDDKRVQSVGSELNLNSSAQMQALLYGMLALPIRLRSFEVSKERAELGLEGSPQANSEAIEAALAEDAPEGSWVREALECFQVAKSADTRRKSFWEPYPLWKHPATGMIHPGINTVGTETRRPSGSSPNPLQWPKRGDGVKFRRCILPNSRMGHDLVVSIDWSQEELRFIAGLALDVEMLSCYIDAEALDSLPQWMIAMFRPEWLAKFRAGSLVDIHTLTASGLAGRSYADFVAILEDPKHEFHKAAKGYRRDSKAVNFGGVYGIGAAKLSRKILKPQHVAKAYLEAKARRYPQFEEWRDREIAKFNNQGYLTTLFGSRKHAFNDLCTRDSGLKGHIERAGVNYEIQGGCADLLKRVLRKAHEQGLFRRNKATLIAPIYDELALSINHRFAVPFIMEMCALMEEPVPGLPCPLVVEPSLGINFGDQIEIGAKPTPERIMAAVEEALGTKMKEAA